MRYGENVLEAKKNPDWVVSLGYKSVAQYLITTKRSSANSDDSVSADSSNKLISAKSETSCISDHEAPDSKEGLEDGETNSKAKVKQNKATYRQVKKSDDYKDVSRSDSAVMSDSQDDKANKDAGCATPLKPAAPRKRKVIEQSPDCVASRLRSRQKWPERLIPSVAPPFAA